MEAGENIWCISTHEKNNWNFLGECPLHIVSIPLRALTSHLWQSTYSTFTTLDIDILSKATNWNVRIWNFVTVSMQFHNKRFSTFVALYLAWFWPITSQYIASTQSPSPRRCRICPPWRTCGWRRGCTPAWRACPPPRSPSAAGWWGWPACPAQCAELWWG